MATPSPALLQPKSILRGHKSQVHAATFTFRNSRLVTGDADGFVIAWDLTIMRARAVWRAHSNAILGIAPWGHDRIITHGRDNRLVVWRLAAADEVTMSTALPLDPSLEERPHPWILHILEVNTMNFCSFSSCTPQSNPEELLVAVPNTLASEAIDIFHLPSQRRIHTVKLGEKNGMVMALSIFFRSGDLVLVAAYENGLAAVARLDNDEGSWVITYQSKVHTQPILSLDVAPDRGAFFTSSADAILAKHPIPDSSVSADKHSSPPSTARQQAPSTTNTTSQTPQSLLSTGIAAQAGHPTTASTSSPSTTGGGAESLTLQLTQPLKTTSTKHSGQQSLRVRSDGRVFATAGWDAKVRVYSCKTMREVAVLKWHQVGCYAAAFATVDPAQRRPEERDAATKQAGATQGQSEGEEGLPDTRSVVVPKLVDMTVRDRRISHVENAHWLAAGSKDGKVSLWDVF